LISIRHATSSYDLRARAYLVAYDPLTTDIATGVTRVPLSPLPLPHPNVSLSSLCPHPSEVPYRTSPHSIRTHPDQHSSHIVDSRQPRLVQRDGVVDIILRHVVQKDIGGSFVLKERLHGHVVRGEVKNRGRSDGLDGRPELGGDCRQEQGNLDDWLAV
jgi:hypothetical protein